MSGKSRCYRRRVLTQQRVEVKQRAAVSVRGLSKSFLMPRRRAWTLKERLRHPIAGLRHDRWEALKDVSFDIAPGEFFAVIGHNGSGKSTLLRCIAGIHPIDKGEVHVEGRIAPFIELGVGFHPQLNAYDNVALAGTLMGLRPAEARRRFPSVIDFAGLEDFVDLPLNNYSSGMSLRLAFSTSFQVDADVLLFDEVLSVGDELFRRKSYEVFERLISEGRTIVFVTHSLPVVEQFADRVLLLDHGDPVALGPPDEVIAEYQRRNAERERTHGVRQGRLDAWGAIADARIETADGERVQRLCRGDDTRFCFELRTRRDIERPVMGFSIRGRDDAIVLTETDRWRRRTREQLAAGTDVAFNAAFPTLLDPGTYRVTPLVSEPGEPGVIEADGAAIAFEVAPPEGTRQRVNGGPAVAPTGRSDRFRRFTDLAFSMARADFKLRYLDSAIGYAWALGQPLLMYAVLYTFWTQVLHTGHNVAHYPLKLLLAIVLFTYFIEATGAALPSLFAKGSMLRKIPFPPLVVPLSSLLTTSFIYGLSLLIVFGFILASGFTPGLAWLEMIPLLALLMTFTAGVGLLLSIAYVTMRDIQPMWVVVGRLLFFLTPVFYPVGIASGGIQEVLMLNPLAVVIEQARHALIDPSAPTAAQAAGGTLRLLVPIGLSIGLLVTGLVLYHSRAQKLVERI
jgi:ABC-type polysaccharide/polyol phosphate transport system ATPase subunit/ABC-type polysaccharide/polyol phosphate export permease